MKIKKPEVHFIIKVFLTEKALFCGASKGFMKALGLHKTFWGTTQKYIYQNTFDDKIDLRLFYFRVTIYWFIHFKRKVMGFSDTWFTVLARLQKSTYSSVSKADLLELSQYFPILNLMQSFTLLNIEC